MGAARDHVVLILTTATDTTADFVQRKLDRRGVRTVRFNPGDFPVQARVGVDFRRGGFAGSLVQDGQRIDVTDVTAVWYRRPDHVQLPSWPPAVRRFAD